MADCTPTSERPRRTAQPAQPGRLADLVRQGLRYVPAVARRYRGNGLDIDELIAAGNLGLVEAALRFDPERKVAFITYADWWVRKAIRENRPPPSGTTPTVGPRPWTSWPRRPACLCVKPSRFLPATPTPCPSTSRNTRIPTSR